MSKSNFCTWKPFFCFLGLKKFQKSNKQFFKLSDKTQGLIEGVFIAFLIVISVSFILKFIYLSLHEKLENNHWLYDNQKKIDYVELSRTV